jgi:hypothetical protein
MVFRMSAPMTKRSFLSLFLALGGCTEYVLVARANKIATAYVPENSRAPFDAVIKSFARDKQLKIVIVPGPNQDEVQYELTDSSIVLGFDNAGSNPEEYAIDLTLKSDASLSQAQVVDLWNELKAKLIAIVGTERWIEKELKKTE